MAYCERIIDYKESYEQLEKQWSELCSKEVELEEQIANLNAQVEAFRDAVLEYLRGNHPSARARLKELAEAGGE